MRRILCVAAAIVFAALFSFGASAAARNTAGSADSGRQDSFGPETAAQLPASLLEIDESAFEGTALTVVDLPDGLEVLGDRAFADVPALSRIAIPDSVRVFGEDVLAGDSLAEVIADPGSAAADWARAQGYRLGPCQTVTGDAPALRLTAVRSPDAGETVLPEDSAALPVTVGREAGEAKAADCTGHYAMNVRTRYFP